MVERGGLQRHEPSGLALGDRASGWVNFGMAGGSRVLTGTVVYIHPEGRFFTLRFDFDKGSFCQCYMLRGRIGHGPWGVEPATNIYKTPPAGWISRQ